MAVTDLQQKGVSFPPKTGPLFIETEGGWDGSVSTVGDAQSREGECAVEEDRRGAQRRYKLSVYYS